jgi:triosephosphate isomerase
LRNYIKHNVSETAAEACRITYTGSVNPQNAEGYAGLPDVDGFVVGRAGLDAIKLTSIIQTLIDTKKATAEAASEL